MPQTKQSWLKAINEFFNKHPEREFYVGEAGPAQVREAAEALWLVGFASQPMNGAGFRRPDIREDQATVPVVIRRPDPAGGFPNPGLIVLDGGMTLPRAQSTATSRSRELEGFGNFIWMASKETAAAGVSLKEALAGAGVIKRERTPPSRPAR